MEEEYKGPGRREVLHNAYSASEIGAGRQRLSANDPLFTGAQRLSASEIGAVLRDLNHFDAQTVLNAFGIGDRCGSMLL